MGVLLLGSGFVAPVAAQLAQTIGPNHLVARVMVGPVVWASTIPTVGLATKMLKSSAVDTRTV